MRKRSGLIWMTLGLVVLLSASCAGFGRVIQYNVPSVSDYKIFPKRVIHANAENIRPLPSAKDQGLPDMGEWGAGRAFRKSVTNLDLFTKTGTIAFIMIQNDSIVYEWYGDGYDSSSVYSSFSLSKILVSSLVGIALDEGKIDSLDQPVSAFIPEFEKEGLNLITIRHLLQMTSGLKGKESALNPFSRLAKMYYGKDLKKEIEGLSLQKEPGNSFKYLNLNTQLLASILENLNGKHLATLFEEKIWSRTGAREDASWSLDREDGTEKAFCCFNFRPRDLGRFGMLLLDGGIYNGDTIIPPAWVKQVMMLDTSGGSTQGYQMNWYTSAEHEDIFGQGLLGQFLYIAPETQTVIVRLGKKIEFSPWYAMFKYLSGTDYRPSEIELSKDELRKFSGDYVFYSSISGDDNLIGKKVRISAKNGYLKVNPEFRSAVKMVPVSENLFYHFGDGRKMCFHFNDAGRPEKFEWTRMGNTWELVPMRLSKQLEGGNK